MNCMKLKQLPGCLDRPRTWQRYLKSRGIYSGSIDGKLEGATAAATQNYQKKTGKRDDDLFCLSFERPDKDHYTEDNTQGPVYLTGPIRDVLRPIAYGYYLLTGKDLVMTSGLRKPETQARLMYEKAKRGSSALGIYNWTLQADRGRLRREDQSQRRGTSDDRRDHRDHPGSDESTRLHLEAPYGSCL